MMDFLALSLPEAAYLYMGLAIQAFVRQSSLRVLPGTMVLLWTLVLLWRAHRRPGGYQAVLGYGLTCLVLLILFWPEAVVFGRLVGRTTDASKVASYAATQDEGAEVITAEDTGQVPDTLRDPTLLAPGFRILLRAITETPLALAKTINSTAHRTFATLMPMQWLLGVELTSEVTSAMADWVHSCYLPAQTRLMQRQEGRTLEDLLPWDNSLLRKELSAWEVTPGAQTGIAWLRGPNNRTTVPCDVYLDAVEFRTQAWLFELKSPRGTPLLEVFQQELGLDALMQARFLVYREMLKAAGPAVPAPSLTAQYGLLRGLSAGAGALGAGAERGVLDKLLKIGTFWKGAGIGAAAGSIAELANEVQRAIDSLSWLVGLAVFLTWWGPYLVGLVNLVLIGLFPFVVLWALVPGTQFQPLAHYFVALLFTSSMPLWWALVDVASRLVATQAPAAHIPVIGMFTGYAWSTMVTTLGILLIPVVTGILLFSVFRAVGGLWRGAV
jgi:hypothetical protein